MDGALVVDKPAGMTSHDVVDRIRKRLRTKRVGHGGTLDPDATGILLVGIGKATRFLSYAQAAPKRYEAVVRFGQTTSSQDASGEVLLERSTSDLSIDRIGNELKGFVGEIEQIPPMVSAVKVGGERLHAKARRGEVVDRPSRKVTIHHLELLDEDLAGSSTITLDVTCSGGTYVRTLAHDLGEAVGCGAHLERLRRTEAAGFTLDDAIALDEVSPEAMRPLQEVVKLLPSVAVDEAAAALVANGRPLPAPADVSEGRSVAVMSGEGFLGVYRVDGDRLVAERVVPR